MLLPGGRRFRALGWAYLAIFVLLAATGSSRAGYLSPAYTWLLPAGAIVFDRRDRLLSANEEMGKLFPELAELLEPYRPHRGRVLWLLGAAHIGAPKFGPRSPVRDIRKW